MMLCAGVRRGQPVRGTERQKTLPIGRSSIALVQEGKTQHGEWRREPRERTGMHLAQHRAALRVHLEAGEINIRVH